MENKTKTIDILKQTRKIPPHVTEERKKYQRNRKTILEALKGEPKTIPQIASDTGLPISDVTWYLMTLQKFGEINVQGLDDMDEYYYYQLKKQ